MISLLFLDPVKKNNNYFKNRSLPEKVIFQEDALFLELDEQTEWGSDEANILIKIISAKSIHLFRNIANRYADQVQIFFYEEPQYCQEGLQKQNKYYNTIIKEFNEDIPYYILTEENILNDDYDFTDDELFNPSRTIIDSLDDFFENIHNSILYISL